SRSHAFKQRDPEGLFPLRREQQYVVTGVHGLQLIPADLSQEDDFALNTQVGNQLLQLSHVFRTDRPPGNGQRSQSTIALLHEEVKRLNGRVNALVRNELTDIQQARDAPGSFLIRKL